jgi:hypothetical protein
VSTIVIGAIARFAIRLWALERVTAGAESIDR